MRLLHPDARELSSTDLFELYDEPGPYLRAGFVASVNGVIAVDGQSAALSSPADKAVFRALRATCDAIIVGAGTARDEDYGPVSYGPGALAFRRSHGYADQTPIVLVSRRGLLDPAAKVLRGPTLLAVPLGADVTTDVEVIRTVEPAALVTALHDRGLTRLLCEGGPSLLTSLLGAGVVDELCLTTAATAVADGPHLLGDVPRTDLSLTSLVHDDPGVLLARWAVVRSTRD